MTNIKTVFRLVREIFTLYWDSHLSGSPVTYGPEKVKRGVAYHSKHMIGTKQKQHNDIFSHADKFFLI